MKLIKFFASTNGRWVRALAGAGLAVVGFLIPGLVWLGLVGLVVLSAGVFDFCLLAPLFKMSFSGKEIRSTN
jgi:hypothetical protein